MRTIQYLNTVKSRYGLTSDYQLAHKLGLRPSGVSNYRHETSFFNEETAQFIAKLLYIHPAQVIAHANAERAERAGKPEMLKMWLDVAAKFATPEPPQT